MQARITAEYTKNKRENQETYPLFFLINDFSERRKWESFKETTIDIYAIQTKYDLQNLTEKERNNYMPFLREIVDLFIEGIKINANVDFIETNANFFAPFELPDYLQWIKLTTKITYNRKINCIIKN